MAAAYDRGKGLNLAAYFEIDDVIDPADSPRWIATPFDSPPANSGARDGERRRHVDAW